MDRDSTLAVVSTTPGVKHVIHDVGVAGTSTCDDDLRLHIALAVYGDPVMT